MYCFQVSGILPKGVCSLLGHYLCAYFIGKNTVNLKIIRENKGNKRFVTYLKDLHLNAEGSITDKESWIARLLEISCSY